MQCPDRTQQQQSLQENIAHVLLHSFFFFDARTPPVATSCFFTPKAQPHVTAAPHFYCIVFPGPLNPYSYTMCPFTGLPFARPKNSAWPRSLPALPCHALYPTGHLGPLPLPDVLVLPR